MRAPPIFHLPIMPTIAENIHCAFGLKVFLSFRNLQLLMSLSKLQKLDPKAIDKCAMVFVLPVAYEKEEIEAFF